MSVLYKLTGNTCLLVSFSNGIAFRTMPNTEQHSSTDYSTWLDQWVVLKVTTGNLQTELVCIVIAESDTAIRICLADICEVDIYKDMILGVGRAWPTLTPASLTCDPIERTSQEMQDIQSNDKSKDDSTGTPAREPTFESRFNDSEYERWSEKLRNVSQSKGK